ncbi:hypothetical protein H0H92_001194 [Tricholoma furcatifolium]|nr:hypothetical protein H0H92_001194 [Tricholoma furcatifolium]
MSDGLRGTTRIANDFVRDTSTIIRSESNNEQRHLHQHRQAPTAPRRADSSYNRQATSSHAHFKKALKSINPEFGFERTEKLTEPLRSPQSTIARYLRNVNINGQYEYGQVNKLIAA